MNHASIYQAETVVDYRSVIKLLPSNIMGIWRKRAKEFDRKQQDKSQVLIFLRFNLAPRVTRYDDITVDNVFQS